MYWFLSALLFGFAFLFSSPRSYAQGKTGLTGIVTDTTGAVISGAHLSFLNTATGTVTRTDSTAKGIYLGAPLAPGSYVVTVESPGFAKYVEKGVLVEVGVAVTVNVQMKLGPTSETVVVSSQEVAIDTTTSELGTTVEPTLVDDLPVEINKDIREIDGFLALTPGSFKGNQVVFNGIPLTQPFQQGNQKALNPPYEMVREFRAVRSASSAQYGLSSGAAASYSMRTGTDTLHGDAFGIYRNNVFDSVGFFPTNTNMRGKVVPPPDTQNNHGFTIGGPVYLPKLYNGRKRTFFLFSWDSYAKTQAQTKLGTVPTPAMKQGDFSNFVDSTGKQIPIYDPQTGKQFQGNLIPKSRFSALSKTLIPLIPDPDLPGQVYGLQNNKLPAVHAVNFSVNTWGFTLNHNFTQNQSVSYSQWAHNKVNPTYDYPVIVPSDNLIQSGVLGNARDTVRVLNYTNVVTPHLVTTAGASELLESGNQSNIQKGVSFAGVQGGNTLPNLTFDGQSSITNWGDKKGRTVSRENKHGLTFVNNWLWTKGRNTFNIGGELHVDRLNQQLCGSCGGVMAFSQASTSIPNPASASFKKYGSSFASFLLGLVDSSNRSMSSEVRLRTYDFSPYVQDDLKVNERLTLNLGLRYDIQTPFRLLDPNGVVVNLVNPNPGANNLPGVAELYSKAGVDWRLVSPRVGFAYGLDKNTVIRAGAFIGYQRGEYDSNPSNGINRLLGGQYNVASTKSNVPSVGSWDTNIMPLPPPIPFSPTMGNGTTIDYINHHDVIPYVENWNVGVQRLFPWSILLTADYVDVRSIHYLAGMNPSNQGNPSSLQYGALLTQQANSTAAKAAGITIPYTNFMTDLRASATVQQALLPFPQYSAINNLYDMSGVSHYRGLEMKGEKRYSNGLSFLTAFTLSSTMDNGPVAGFATTTVVPLNKYNQATEYTRDDTNVYNLSIAPVYQLPFGKGRRFLNHNSALNYLVGGWKVGAILQYQGGAVFGVTQSGVGLNGINRPNLVGKVSGHYDNQAVADYLMGKRTTAPLMFDITAFQNTGSQYILGNSLRQYVQLKSYPNRNENFDAMKTFTIAEKVKATFRIDYFNAFNRAIFPDPVEDINQSTFGQVVPSSTANSNRQGQFQLRVEF